MQISWKPAFIFIWELVKMIVIALVIIVPIRYFLIQPFFVQGASMEPNFQDGQYLVIDEISYRFRAPIRGEVVVFKYPYSTTNEYFIKRIVGLPNETVKISNNQITITNQDNPNDVILKEPYLSSSLVTDTYEKDEWSLKPDEYFLMGDNRTVSYDSRRFGPIQKKYITGRVWFRAFPFSTAQVFSIPPNPAPTFLPISK